MLEEKLEELFHRLAESGCGAPMPKQVVLVELGSAQAMEDDRPLDTLSNLRTPEKYELRFAELLAQGHSWLNLSYYGLLDGRALVVVEIPGTPPRAPGGATSINFSGPTQRVAAAGWDARVELVIR